MPVPGLMNTVLRGQGMKGRSLRASAFSLLHSQSENVLRLVSTLILTRLLMPEAFGLMAIATVFTTGLQMLSDVGLRDAVVRSERGDDRVFLDTVWTLQILRGLLLWGIALLLAWPVAAIYDEPILVQLLPVAALMLVARGFWPTRVATATRHLALGRLTALALVGQILSIAIMVAMAYATGSVWALAIGGAIGSFVATALYHLFLPGARDGLRLDRSSVVEIVTFGKFIVLTTAAAFAAGIADRAILGLYLPVAIFGVFHIGWMLTEAVTKPLTAMEERVLYPLYRMRHPIEGAANRRAMRTARRLVITAALAVSTALAFVVPWMVDLLFDPRYALAGPVAVLLATATVPRIVTMGTIRSALSRGDSRSFFAYMTAMAACKLALMSVGLWAFGMVGFMIGIAMASILTYPLLARIAHRYASWDPVADAAFLTVGLATHLAACWVHRDAIAAMLAAT